MILSTLEEKEKRRQRQRQRQRREERRTNAVNVFAA